MAMIKCDACKEVISKKAVVCPKCGHPNKKAKDLSGGQIIAGLAFCGVLLWFFAGGGLEGAGNKQMQKIENKVAADAVNQYNIAKRGSDAIQICVQAGFAAAAYLQAEDETNYHKWKSIEKSECRAAGIDK